MARGETRRRRLEDWLERNQPARVEESHWDELRAALAPVSSKYLRDLLRECGVPLAPLVAGVRQASFEELAASLTDLAACYQQAVASGDRMRARRIRQLVIESKDHARWALRRTSDAGRRQAREEMIAWMLTWLENPPLFAAWVALRQQVLGRA